MKNFLIRKIIVCALCSLLYLGTACFSSQGQALVKSNSPASPADMLVDKAISTMDEQPPVTTNTTTAADAPAAPTNNVVADALAATSAAGDSNDPNVTAPEPGALPTHGVISTAVSNSASSNLLKAFQVRLDLGREQRRQKSTIAAIQTLVSLLLTNAPPEIKRLALFELALVEQDDGKYLKAEQVFAQYIHNYPDDPSVPEVLLRQGLIYRQMGVNNLAISKFYAVMSTSLKLKLDNMDYYKKLVLQAQIEIADSYYLDGKYEEASDYFGRILKTGDPEVDRAQIEFKQIRSLSFLTNNAETIARAQVFLDSYSNAPEVPEIRFLVATSLKKLGHNQESMKQVLLLLQSQQQNVEKNPEAWHYWQQRAGNEIANQLYKEGDYLSALQIYLSLADLNKSPEWQLPVWYQTGLVYEQMQQWEKAQQTYTRIVDRQKELTASNSTPSLASLIEMAKWRKDYIDWAQKARLANASYQPGGTNNPASTLAP